MVEGVGKRFENNFKHSIEVGLDKDVDIYRLYDQTGGYAGIKNICDFICYKKPVLFYVECKTVASYRFPFSNITDRQFEGLLEKSKIDGVIAGVLINFREPNVTAFMDIRDLNHYMETGARSISSEECVRLGQKLEVLKQNPVNCVYNTDKFFKDILEVWNI